MNIHNFFIKIFTFFTLLAISLSCIMPVFAEETDTSEYTQVTSRFSVLSRGKMYDLEIDYTDAFFERDPEQYYHDLAKASFGMAVAAFRDGKDEGAAADANIKNFLREAGFQNYESIWYDQAPTSSSVASAMASKKVGDSTLIAFICCGEGYGQEWLSNLTVGDGDVHKGFSDSADLCEERLFAYMDKHGISGNIKLWISGFSRASAIGNLLAGRMTEDSRISDVYAYFYATPNNTKNPVAYHNIYNIVGQNDPVPMVPLTEWGFGRNGIDKYTPAQESNSTFIQSAMLANVVENTIAEIPFRNNPAENKELRTVLEFLASIFPTNADYASTLQPQLLKVWVQHSGSDILSVLREALNNINTFDPERQQALNAMIEFLDRVIYKYISGNDIQVADGSWNNDVNLGSNVVLEHLPEVYASWIFSTNDPDMLYADSTESLRLVIEGDFNLQIADEWGLVQEISSQNEEAVYEPGVPQRDESGELIYLYTSNNDGKAVVNIPKDHNYSLILNFLSDCSVTIFGTRYAYGTATDIANEIQMFHADKDDVYTMVWADGSDNFRIVNDKGEIVTTFRQSLPLTQNSLILMEEMMTRSFTLRQVIISAISLVTIPLLLFIIAFIVFLIRRKKGKSKTFVTASFLIIEVIFAAGAVLFSIMLPNLRISYSLAALMSSLMAVINIIRYKKASFVIPSALLMAASFATYYFFFDKNLLILLTAIFAVFVIAEIALTIFAMKKRHSFS